MVAKHVLKLSEEERGLLSEVAKGTRDRRKVAQWKVVRAKALLDCDEGEHGPSRPDAEIATAVGVTERSLREPVHLRLETPARAVRLGEQAAAEADPEHRMPDLPVPAALGVQPGEESPAALEQLLRGVEQQALAEAARARQEAVLAALRQPQDVRRLVHSCPRSSGPPPGSRGGSGCRPAASGVAQGHSATALPARDLLLLRRDGRLQLWGRRARGKG